MTATITNTGNADGLQTINLRLYPDEASIPEDYLTDPVMDNAPVSLGPGESTSVTLSTSPVPEYQANSTFYVHMGSDDEADYTSVVVNPAPPALFDSYVAGQRGYLQTGANASEPMAPIDFPGCDNFQVTEEELNASPDYLPAPECITAFGEIDHGNNTWEGNISFPTTYMEQTDPNVGEVYVEAAITPNQDGASGTWNHDTGELSLETTVSINVSIFQASHGTDWENVSESDRITDPTCHIPNVALNATTEKSFQTLSTFPNTSTVSGERLQNGTGISGLERLPDRGGTGLWKPGWVPST
ncbi:MAG: hypothetical protein U5K37_09070 [Natrialbaceae archaeon]|nr:hypothetical protein [Natrialbaceae archaeon]